MSDYTFSPEPWMGTKDIAEHLGVTVVTVRKWIVEEKIPCYRVGKLWKFKASEVDFLGKVWECHFIGVLLIN